MKIGHGFDAHRLVAGRDLILGGVTIDFDTVGENGPELQDTVTLRHRDDGRQERVKISELAGRLLPLIS